jgi:hypothetical protein
MSNQVANAPCTDLPYGRSQQAASRSTIANGNGSDYARCFNTWAYASMYSIAKGPDPGKTPKDRDLKPMWLFGGSQFIARSQ